MAVTIRASEQGLQKVEQARKKKGWKATAYSWCDAAQTSVATLRRFRQRDRIQQDTFIEICKAVGLNWQEIVDETIPTQASDTKWLLLLSATIEEVDKPIAEAIADFANQLLGGALVIKLKRIELGSVVLVLESPLEAFERIEYLFRTRQLTEILGIPVTGVRLESATTFVNWRQWLENFLPYWQQPELVLATGGHRSADRPDETEAIANLIHQLQTSKDELTLRTAAETLGEIGASNHDAIHALTELLRKNQNEETRWQAALSLGKIDPSNPAAGVKRAKVIDLEMQPEAQAVVLIVGFRPDSEAEISISLRVEPIDEQTHLPPNLKLVVLDESGVVFIEAQPTATDDFLPQKFSGLPGDKFSVKLSLGDVSITEELVI